MTGIFTISLDTELMWGMFEKKESKRYIDSYYRSPEIISELCDLFSKYDVPATWAMVAHLFDNCEQDHSAIKQGRDRDDYFPCENDVARELWYAPSILETIANCDTEQEIGLHGYSHMVFTDYPRKVIKKDLNTAVTVAESHGLSPSTFIFPRNQISHLDLLVEQGFSAYRGVDDRWYERYNIPEITRKPFRFIDERLACSPPVVSPEERSGLVCIPGSHPLRPLDKGWRWVPAEHRVMRAKKGLQRAAQTGRIYHIWFHPFNLAEDVTKHLDILKEILIFADELRTKNKLDILPMKQIAMAFRDEQW